jgi:hypothetical protein
MQRAHEPRGVEARSDTPEEVEAVALRSGPTIDEQLEAAEKHRRELLEKHRRERVDARLSKHAEYFSALGNQPALVTDLIKRCRGVSREQRPTTPRVRRTTRARSGPSRSTDDPSPSSDLSRVRLALSVGEVR